MIPVTIQSRYVDPESLKKCVAEGLEKDLAAIVAGRLTPHQVDRYLKARLNHLDDPETLPDIDKAAKRVLCAIQSKEVISLSCDHDADGTGAAAIMCRALVAMGHSIDRIQFSISRRLTDGYGLNEAVAERILAAVPRPSLVITADNGSSDEDRIRSLTEAGIDVVVTDHHGIPPSGIPLSAYAVVSPVRSDSKYPDPTICGAMVAWLLMSHTRRLGITGGHLQPTTSSFKDLLGIAAISTVADCVSLASTNNRAVVSAGLRMLNSSREPFARALQSALASEHPINEETVGFEIAPRLAAHGRLDESMPAIEFLLSESEEIASCRLETLTLANEERKAIQKSLTESAVTLARAQIAEGRVGLAVHLVDGMSGVHGITSSRITEMFGVPSAMISPVVGRDDALAVSCRSVPGVDVSLVLNQIRSEAPQAVLSCGGHAAAAGARIASHAVADFALLFDAAVRKQSPALRPNRRFTVDGDLSGQMISIAFYQRLQSLGPFGRGFEAPLFKASIRVLRARIVGKNPVHLQIDGSVGGQAVAGIWFNALAAPGSDSPVEDLTTIEAACSLSVNTWRGKSKVQLTIHYATLRDRT